MQDHARGQGEPAGLYVHVPFCARACPYCDFDFEVGRAASLAASIERWFEGLEREWQARRSELDSTRFDTIYLGGGTPSLLGPTGLARTIEWLRERTSGARLRELTVELNPEHVDDAMIAALVGQGVDRVSLGVQSLSEAGLRQLGRAHAPDDATRAIQQAVAAGLRTSADLIVGWPGHDEAQLRHDLDRVLELGAEHISLYALTIEPDTPWPKLVRRGLRVLPDDDRQAELLIVAEQHLREAGWIHYEVASHARPGAEAIHNGKYWRWVDVLALGPSAASVEHREREVARRRNRRGLAAWTAEPGEPGELEILSGAQAAAEGLWLALRSLRGFEVELFLRRFGVDRSWLDARIARSLALGNLEWVDTNSRERLRVAPDRWLWHDSIAVDLLE